MKAIKGNLVITVVTLGASLFFSACDNERRTEEESIDRSEQTTAGYRSEPGKERDSAGYMMDMNDMMGQMNRMNMTGDIDVDFANMMIHHHQGGIAMAEKVLSQGNDEKVKAKAREIMEEQEADIKKLEAFVKENPVKEGSGQMHHHKEMHSSMDKMMRRMDGMSMTGDADKDFVNMMIHHHEASIEMAKNELEQGDDKEMKKMAEKLISDQSKEIRELEAMNPQ